MDWVGSSVVAQEAFQCSDLFAKLDVGGVAEGDNLPDPIGAFGTDPLVEGLNVVDHLRVMVLPRAEGTLCGVEVLLKALHPVVHLLLEPVEVVLSSITLGFDHFDQSGNMVDSVGEVLALGARTSVPGWGTLQNTL